MVQAASLQLVQGQCCKLTFCASDVLITQNLTHNFSDRQLVYHLMIGNSSAIVVCMPSVAICCKP